MANRYMMKGAFWVSPMGDIEMLPMDKYHIADVTANPRKFGLSPEDISNAYDKSGEAFGKEGEARDFIMTEALKKGWIRIRRRLNNYTVQIWQLDNKTIANLEHFFKVMSEGYQGFYCTLADEVRIHVLKTDDLLPRIEVDDLIHGKLYN